MELDFEKVYEDEFVTVEVNDDRSFIQVVWLQHPDSNNFRRCFMQAAELAIIRKCHFWLSDARAVHYLEFADQNWMLQYMVPLLRTSHLTKYARITSEESFSLLDVDRIIQNVELSDNSQTNDHIALFLDKKSALNWLFRLSRPKRRSWRPE
jgi:hypothetical protein